MDTKKFTIDTINSYKAMAKTGPAVLCDSNILTNLCDTILSMLEDSEERESIHYQTDYCEVTETATPECCIEGNFNPNKLAGTIRYYKPSRRLEKTFYSFYKTPKAIASANIEFIYFTKQVLECFRCLNINKVEDFANLTAEELYAIPGVSYRNICKIMHILDRANLKLKGI